jgi:membrane peptidoglycan carboxypeptidase
MSTWRPISPEPLWKRLLPEWMHGLVQFGFFISFTAGVAALGVAFFYFLLAMRFDLAEVASLPAGTTFYDRAGKEITTAAGPGRNLVRREDIPDFLVKSLQAREDARFFQHHGIDVRGLARATVRNLRDRDFTQGASTLTMQLARNTYKNMRAKSLHRKFLEIAVTLRIENHYSKDEILCHYLNRIYFGSGADGIEQASRIYFGLPTRDLNEGECALLVGIIRGPHIFSPLRNFDAAIEQRDQTLARLLVTGTIDEARRAEIAAQPIRLVTGDQRIIQRSYALQAVDRELDRILDDLGIQSGGLEVHTTLDTAWQARLENDLTDAVGKLERETSWPHPTHAAHPAGEEPAYLQFAAVTTETRTGAVLALIGGRDFTHSRYDRSIHLRRDLGSAFEPFVAAAAAERGKLVLPGRPVQTGRQVGPAEVERIARRCGLSGDFAQSEDVFRGIVRASPMQVSIGLATLGNEGKRPKPFFVREIRDASGEVLYKNKNHLTPAVSPNAALDATSILRRAGGTRCLTGTTGSEHDAWTLRLGPSGATAIWIGFDRPAGAIAPQPRLKALLEEFVTRLGNSQ